MRHIWRVVDASFIAQIKDERTKRNLTQAELARLAGVPLRTFQRFESGDRGSRLDTVLRVLDALGLEIGIAPKRRPSLDELSKVYGGE